MTIRTKKCLCCTLLSLVCIAHNPLGPSVEYSLHLTKMFDFKIRREHKKNSYERCAYESVDVRSPFWVISHRSTETSTPGLKRLWHITFLFHYFHPTVVGILHFVDIWCWRLVHHFLWWWTSSNFILLLWALI